MPASKIITDLQNYKGVLPYASEMFGVYQPMIGWKSKRTLDRFQVGINQYNISKFKNILSRYDGIADIKISDMSHDTIFYNSETINTIQVGKPKNALNLKYQNDSVLLSELSKQIREVGLNTLTPEQWKSLVNEDNLLRLLQGPVYAAYKAQYDSAIDPNILNSKINFTFQNAAAIETLLNKSIKTESAIASALIDLMNNNLPDKLEAIFFIKNIENPPSLSTLFDEIKSQNFDDPFSTFDPKGNIKENVSISPLGIVHLYRQYFFELDTFLGTPVNHVWLSPGSSVELVEVSSRKTIEEKYTEFATESVKKEETDTTEQDELSSSIKSDNKKDLKLGFSTTVSQSFGSGNFSATGSLNMDNTQQEAREQTNKRMKQQSKKLSSEIKQNYKTSFKTISEVTDTQSKRYVLNNTTNKLLNYEMRRKMRQVGVQVQDIGSYLCWQTFVDDPGNDLGLPDLIHVAKVTDVEGKPKHPEMPVAPEAIFQDYAVQIPFIGTSADNDDKGELYIDGKESNGDSLFIQTIFPQKFSCSTPGYLLDMSSVAVSSQDSVATDIRDLKQDGSMNLYLKSVHFNDRPFVTVTVKIKWNPDPIKYQGLYAAAIKKYESDMAEYKVKEEKAEREDYINKVKERVTLASNITKRKFEDLREEERTIIYRKLIKTLMTEKNYKENTNIVKTEYATFHILSELINAVFDIDKMLYFVAPEWWRPRSRTKVSYGDPNNAYMMEGTNASWSNEQKRDGNYYITEKSSPAPMGSSLGWLLQLDGDEQRNSFLNAPWVKAVIPIRPGKEQIAINWLEKSGVEGADGLDDKYSALNDDELIRINVFLNTNRVPAEFSDAEWETVSQTTVPAEVTIRKALEFLCAEVAYKEKMSSVVPKSADDEINDDNTVLSAPIEKVYEHGFYPLKGGFKAVVEDYFEIVSQWIEVLPTDQIVPVEVKYNAATGRLDLTKDDAGGANNNEDPNP